MLPAPFVYKRKETKGWCKRITFLSLSLCRLKMSICYQVNGRVPNYSLMKITLFTTYPNSSDYRYTYT